MPVIQSFVGVGEQSLCAQNPATFPNTVTANTTTATTTTTTSSSSSSLSSASFVGLDYASLGPFGSANDNMLIREACVSLEGLVRGALVRESQSTWNPVVMDLFSLAMKLYCEGLCQKECFVIALIYGRRLLNKSAFGQMTIDNVNRFFIVSVMVASKFLDDLYCRNSYFAVAGGMSKPELNALEVRYCFLMDFRFSVTAEDFQTCCGMLMRDACTRETQRLPMQPSISSLPIPDTASSACALNSSAAMPTSRMHSIPALGLTPIAAAAVAAFAAAAATATASTVTAVPSTAAVSAGNPTPQYLQTTHSNASSSSSSSGGGCNPHHSLPLSQHHSSSSTSSTSTSISQSQPLSFSFPPLSRQAYLGYENYQLQQQQQQQQQQHRVSYAATVSASASSHSAAVVGSNNVLGRQFQSQAPLGMTATYQQQQQQQQQKLVQQKLVQQQQQQQIHVQQQQQQQMPSYAYHPYIQQQQISTMQVPAIPAQLHNMSAIVPPLHPQAVVVAPPPPAASSLPPPIGAMHTGGCGGIPWMTSWDSALIWMPNANASSYNSSTSAFNNNSSISSNNSSCSSGYTSDALSRTSSLASSLSRSSSLASSSSCTRSGPLLTAAMPIATDPLGAAGAWFAHCPAV